MSPRSVELYHDSPGTGMLGHGYIKRQSGDATPSTVVLESLPHRSYILRALGHSRRQMDAGQRAVLALAALASTFRLALQCTMGHVTHAQLCTLQAGDMHQQLLPIVGDKKESSDGHNHT